MNGWSDASSMTALVCPSKSTGSTTMLTRAASPRLEEIRDEIRRHVGEQDALLFDRALARQALAECDGFDSRPPPCA